MFVLRFETELREACVTAQQSATFEAMNLSHITCHYEKIDDPE
jgi:hypothetical protein